MSTYNAYFNKKTVVGKSTPIWLGVVSPIAAGAALASDFAKAGMFIPAGCPMELKSGVATPFVGWKVVSVDTTDHAITIKSNYFNILPKADDILGILGSTFATTGAAGKVSSIAADSTEGQFVVTMTDAKLDSASEGDILTFSAASAVAASGASIKVQPTHYLYNDICIDAAEPGVEISNICASAALVNHHGEGLLINRTLAAEVASQMRSAVPGVIQDSRF